MRTMVSTRYTMQRVMETNQPVHALIFDESLVEPRYRSQEDNSWGRPVALVSGCDEWAGELLELTINWGLAISEEGALWREIKAHRHRKTESRSL